jgi:hypothetical protein
MTTQAIGRPTLRAHEVNWGDRTRLEGRVPQTLAWISLEDCFALTVYATVKVDNPNHACVVTIEWGNGGSAIRADYLLIKRLRVPLVASVAKVSGRLVTVDGSSLPSTALGEVYLFIGCGSDGETLRNTRWITQIGSGGVIEDGPQRVMRVEGFNAGSSKVFVQLFDGAVAGGTPAIEVPASAGERFVVERFDSQGFFAGVTWGASSTPFTYTADKSASVRMDVELLL